MYSVACSFRNIGVNSFKLTDLLKQGMPKRLKNFTVEKKLKKIKTSQDIVTIVDNSQQIKKMFSSDVKILTSPIKSDSDKKEYRVIQLPNGLTACLISDVENLIDLTQETEETIPSSEEDGDSSVSSLESDDESIQNIKPEEKLAAAGLCVGVGSFSDPRHIQGMAHFLEHMVFMGSKKYPEENDFDSFVKKRGGSNNATTDCETTTFYFECQDRHLLDTLDKFAHFFISPLLKRETMTREREAIESEFQMALPSDSDRRDQLLFSLAFPDHPVNTFTWGNLTTLRDNITDDALHKALNEFRQRHYSSHRMTLAIQARLSLDVLQKYVIDCFSDVPNNNLPPVDVTPFKENVFDMSLFHRLYYVNSIKDVCQVNLTWSMPSLLKLYKSKPHQYVSWLLGHEGKGSLLSYLRKKVWVLSISTGNGESGSEHNSMYALFTVSLKLTDEGMKNLEEVLNAVFSYLQLIKESGCREEIFKEIKSIEDTLFRFLPERSAADFVETLAEAMHFYPPEHYLTGPDLYYEYNSDEIKKIYDYLKPEYLNITVLSKKKDTDNIVYDKQEKWFKTEYTDKEIPINWLKVWQNICVYPEFSLPEPNLFITDNFDLISCNADLSKYPEKILNTEKMELWYRPDNKFKLPTAYLHYHFISPLTLQSPQNAVMFDLYISILDHQLNEDAYPAVMAGLSYSLGVSDAGMVLKVSGYNQKLLLLLDLMLKHMYSFPDNLTTELFNALKMKQTKNYYNYCIKPEKLEREVRINILMNPHWSIVDKHAAISEITVDVLKIFSKQFLRRFYIQSLVQGNITKEEALSASNNVLEKLKCEALLPNTLPKIRVSQIPLGKYYCRVMGFNQDDTNMSIINYYQSGPATIRSMATLELLMMILEEPLFDILRTKEQLGYHVFCSLRDTLGILGYSITVNGQTDKHSADYIDERIEAFVKHAHSLIENMSENEIDDIKQDLIKLKQCADVCLKGEVSRNWAEIISKEFLFDRLEKEIECIKNIEKVELVEWLNDHSLWGNVKKLRKLSVQIVGCTKSPENNKCEAVHSSPELLPSKIYNDCELSNEITVDDKPLCYGGNVDHPLKLIISNISNDKRCFITDIENFKSKLFLYPLHRTK